MDEQPLHGRLGQVGRPIPDERQRSIAKEGNELA
jgi:hypothetical protein